MRRLREQPYEFRTVGAVRDRAFLDLHVRVEYGCKSPANWPNSDGAVGLFICLAGPLAERREGIAHGLDLRAFDRHAVALHHIAHEIAGPEAEPVAQGLWDSGSIAR